MSAQRGFSMVEVMIAITVLMIGMSALARLSLVSIVDTAGAAHRLQARALVTEYVEALAFTTDTYPTWSATPPTSPAIDGQFAADWALRVTDRLLDGQAAVCRDSSPGDGEPGDFACDGAGPLLVKMTWRSRSGDARREVAVLP